MFTRSDIVYGEDVHPPTLYVQKVKGIIIHLWKTVQMFIYMLTWLFQNTKTTNLVEYLTSRIQLIISATVQFILHIFYFVSIFYNFITQPLPTTITWINFVKLSNKAFQTSPLLHLTDFNTKSILKWIFEYKGRNRTVYRRSLDHWNNLNMTEIWLRLF